MWDFAGAFPYAKCFMCGEMGHLSRSCPDNPKGLYAEGKCTKTKTHFSYLLIENRVTLQVNKHLAERNV